MTLPMMLVGIGLAGVIFIPGLSRQNDDPNGPVMAWFWACAVLIAGVVWEVWPG